MDKSRCFGFYSGQWTCRNGCKASLQCKALVNSDGLDTAADLLELLVDALPDQPYLKASTARGIMSQIKDPHKGFEILLNQVPAQELFSASGLVDPF